MFGQKLGNPPPKLKSALPLALSPSPRTQWGPDVLTFLGGEHIPVPTWLMALIRMGALNKLWFC